MTNYKYLLPLSIFLGFKYLRYINFKSYEKIIELYSYFVSLISYNYNDFTILNKRYHIHLILSVTK